jgi:hypothetical protein
VNIPKLTAGETLLTRPVPPMYRAQASVVQRQAGVSTMVSIDCLQSCVGSETALHCSGQCGMDLNCWRTCAGPDAAQCISRCF